ncbi:MAG TPA: hypothetical protein VNV65_00015 [Candidatus Solibacter sp.]|nr:hypothetical protein [Candidatus Solibacter sp.]
MDYPAMVRRVQELVWEFVPAGSSVAVVSKGDPDLVLFDGRQGLHYPQTTAGLYLGHHPASGAEAVAHLESLRQRGAEYLVIPATSTWWLDHYSDLRRHLQAEGHIVRRDDTCVIYGLGRPDPESVPSSGALEKQLLELVSALLPENSTVIALGSSYPALAGAGTFDLLDGPLITGLPQGPSFGDPLAGFGDRGADYLVIPATTTLGASAGRGLVERARLAWPVVADQKNVATVLSLKPADREPAEATT